MTAMLTCVLPSLLRVWDRVSGFGYVDGLIAASIYYKHHLFNAIDTCALIRIGGYSSPFPVQTWYVSYILWVV